MRQELQQKLFDKYPKIFADRTKPKTKTCMCWGLEVSDGWYDLIDVLCEALTYTYSTYLQIDEEDGLEEIYEMNSKDYRAAFLGKSS